MIIALIPLAIDQSPVPCVVEALKSQSIEFEIEYAFVYNPQPYVGMEDMPRRLKNCALARNLCLKVFRSYMENPEYDGFLMLDSDCVICDTVSIELLYGRLRANPAFAAMALNKAPTGYSVELEQEHIDCGAVMFQKSFFDLSLEYRYAEGAPCECMNMAADIRAKGKRIGFLDSKHRIDDLHISNPKGAPHGTNQ